MTSVVDTSVKHFHNLMAGAPVLSGTVGAMIGVLDACLINGFDVKTGTSLVVAAGVATLSFTGSHSATVDSVILVSGVTDITALNGEQKITAIGDGFVKFATAAADGTAAGTVSFKMAPAGWVKVFTGTNLAVYQSTDVQSTKMFFRVDDTGTTSCRLRGYETMTDVNTGTGMFPTDAQISGGGYLNKSSVANTTGAKWRLVFDSRGFIFNAVGYSSSVSSVDTGRTIFIGDFAATRPGGDPYAFLLGCGTTGSYVDTSGCCDQGVTYTSYAPRAYHGLGGAVGHAAVPETGASAISGTDSSMGAFPSKIDGSLRLSRRSINESSTPEPRGILPCLYTVPQSNVGAIIAPLSIISGTGPLVGRKLMAIGCGASSTAYPSTALGISFIDITGPWAR